MSTIKTFEKRLEQISIIVRRILVTIGEHRNIHKKRKLYSSVVLSGSQEQLIAKFFKAHYGKPISTNWHRLYQSYCGIYRIDYFPEILLSARLEPLLNPYRIAEIFGDKNLLDSFFGKIENLHIPYTYVSSVNGVLRDENTTVITRNGASEHLHNRGKCVLKKSVETSSGRDIMICDIQDGVDTLSGMGVLELLELYGDDFVVQELIEQHEDLSRLNSSSLNTFRVITYYCRERIYHCPVTLRLGRAKADRDNIHYGGIVVGVGLTGYLREYAFSESGERFQCHPDSKVFFGGYQIQQLPKLLEVAERLHMHMPYLGMISWDLSLDKNDRAVLVEMNTTGQSAWFPQMANGEPLFGENTSKMLRLIGKSPKTRLSQRVTL